MTHRFQRVMHRPSTGPNPFCPGGCGQARNTLQTKTQNLYVGSAGLRWLATDRQLAERAVRRRPNSTKLAKGPRLGWQVPGEKVF